MLKCYACMTNVNQADGTTLPPPFDSDHIGGWSSYKLHVPVMHKQEATDSVDIYGNVWRNWHASADVIRRTAWLQGLLTGLLVGAGLINSGAEAPELVTRATRVPTNDNATAILVRIK